MRETFRILLLGIAVMTTVDANAQSMIGVGPKLTTAADGTVILSYIDRSGPGSRLVYQRYSDHGWGPGTAVASGDNWFVNWADFPSVFPIDENRWAAHWLVRQPAGGYAYDITMAISDDAGATWSEPFLIHDDGTPTEHGFVTLYQHDGRLGAVWLDGRNMAEMPVEPGSSSHGESAGMTLRAAFIESANEFSSEAEVDDLTCDCCQTDVAVTNDGPVVIYRNRTPDEIRDIYVARWVDGAWQAGIPVAYDGWNIPGCPVNGPRLDLAGGNLSASWFTAAGERSRVRNAWSSDDGESFAPARDVASDAVVGYVGQAAVAPDTVVVSWLCGADPTALGLCYRTVRHDGAMSEIQRLGTDATVARMSVPQVAALADDLLFVWTDRVGDQYRIASRRVSTPVIIVDET